MTAPVKPMCLFTAKFVVVAKLALLTHVRLCSVRVLRQGVCAFFRLAAH